MERNSDLVAPPGDVVASEAPGLDRANRLGHEPAAEVAGLRERTHQTLVDGDASGDDERLRLLESLLDELEQELERDVGEAATPRR